MIVLVYDESATCDGCAAGNGYICIDCYWSLGDYFGISPNRGVVSNYYIADFGLDIRIPVEENSVTKFDEILCSASIQKAIVVYEYLVADFDLFRVTKYNVAAKINAFTGLTE